MFRTSAHRTRLLLCAIAVLTLLAVSGRAVVAAGAHDFSFTSIEGQALPLSRYEGHAILIVNTASLCGFTHQYSGLQSLWDAYRERGLVVLAVPSNDFGAQEPGSEAEIKQFCEVNFDLNFPLTSKTRVKGGVAHPFYRWATEQLGPQNAPRWNFHKYLVAPDGSLVGAFPSTVEPQSQEMITAVEAVLPAKPKPSS